MTLLEKLYLLNIMGILPLFLMTIMPILILIHGRKYLVHLKEVSLRIRGTLEIKKTIHIEGTIGTLPVNQDIQVFIIGINHNSEKEGTNRVHIQIGKNTSGKSIAFCDNKYDSRVYSTGYFSMNDSDTNIGGWNATQMKNIILHSGNAPSDTGTNTFMAALPSDLRAVMKSCTKYTDNVGGGTETESNITATTEYLPLLSEFEVFGNHKYDNGYERLSQAQYDYYKAGNSKIFYGVGARTSASSWWLRSPCYKSNKSFCNIYYGDGTQNYISAYYSVAVTPIFFV